MLQYNLDKIKLEKKNFVVYSIFVGYDKNRGGCMEFEDLGLREKKAARTLALIAECFAEELFANGFDNVSIRDVCEKAEVAEATFYNYFPRKVDVLLYMIRIKELHHQCVVIDQNKSASNLDLIEAYMLNLLELVIHQPDVWFEVMSVLMKYGYDFPELTLADKLLACGDYDFVEEMEFGGTVHLFEKYLTKAKEAGELPTTFDVEEGVLALDTLMCGAPMSFRKGHLDSLKEFVSKKFRELCHLCIFIFSLVFALPTAKALDDELLELSKSQVIEMAIENSEDYQIKEYDIQKLKQQYKEARSTIYPQINAEMTWAHNNQYAGVVTEDYSTTASIGASQVVYSFGKVLAAIKGAENAFNASKYSKQASRQDLIYAVNQSYYACLLAENVFNIVNASYENTLENKRILEKRSAGGRVSKRDNIKIAADVAARLPQLNTAKAQLNSALNVLKTQIGIANTKEVKLVNHSNNEFSVLDEDRLREHILEYEPNLKALREQLGFADNYAKLKRSEHFPTISAFYDLNRNGSDSSSYVGSSEMDTYSTIGLKVTVPIFSGWKINAQLKQATIEKEKVKLELVKLEENLMLELNNAMSDYRELIKTLEANDNAVYLAEESFTLSQDMFRSGQISLTDLNDAELQLTNQKLAKEQTLFDLNLTKAKIDKLTELEGDKWI